MKFITVGYVGDRIGLGHMHGKGTYKWEDGNTYEGDWDNDVRHGRGTYIWAGGRMYEGD